MSLIITVVTLLVTAHSRERPKLRQVHAFTLGNTVNGGLVGALGPSVSTFQASTGLSHSALARTFCLNRLAKFAGTFIWASYANRLQQGQAGWLSPRVVLCAVMAVEVVCSLLIVSVRTSALALQLALAVFGMCYGLADSGFDLLTVWSETDDPKTTRTHVAMLNAGFTAGAVLTPAVVSAALPLGGTCYACFFVLALLSSLAALGMAACDMLPGGAPPPPSRKEACTAADATVLSQQQSLAVVICMVIVLFCSTGSEHVIGTWLPTLGADVGRIPMATMAAMSAFYWTTICAGRVGWCLLSSHIMSAWPVLAVDGAIMLVAGVLFASYRPAAGSWQLWIGTLLLGLGCASSLPAALTMPTEVRVALTPNILMCLNLAGTVGEMIAPFACGLFLQRGLYRSLGLSVVVMMTALLGATGFAWGVSHNDTAFVY